MAASPASWSERDGKAVRIGARRGVLMNVGGFSRNEAMRERFQPQPSSDQWTNANPGDTGEVIEMAMALGAAVDCMDEAWWVVTSLGPDGKPPRPGGYAADGTPLPFMHHLDLSLPYSMMVDQLGERFCDEAGAYMEIGQRMYRRQQETGPRGAELGRDGQPPARVLPVGHGAAGPGAARVAGQRLHDPGRLDRRAGREDAHRSRRPRAHDRALQRVLPHAASTPTSAAARAPSTAATATRRSRPTPTSARSRSRRSMRCACIPATSARPAAWSPTSMRACCAPTARRSTGLYATGNCTASVVGRCYPGAGASIGASFTFGFIAAHHAAGVARALTSRIPMSSEPKVDRAVLVDIYRRMALIQRSDERFRAVIKAGKIVAPYYSPRGQECIPAAVSVSLGDEDYVCTIYRGIHDMLAKGVPSKLLWAEIAGKATGTCKGKGGPMHITHPTSGVMVTTGIVGSSMPIANGLALAAQIRGEKRVAVAYFGDGASNIGAFHESLNMAAVWKLPVVFVCQNNGYGEHTRYELATSAKRISDRAAGYQMPGVTVDGNDPLAVYEAARAAIIRARAGDGPTLIEAMTFRFQGHVFGDADAYMAPGEKAGGDGARSGAALSRLAARRRRRTKRELADARGRDRPRDRRSRRLRAGEPVARRGGTAPRRVRRGDRGMSTAEADEHDPGRQPGAGRGDGARRERDPARRGHRRRPGGRHRRRHQGPVDEVRHGARALHADLGAGDHRRGDRRGASSACGRWPRSC